MNTQGKGVITHIFEPEEMPIGKNGLRADFIMDGSATVNRMNFGRKYEQYLNSVKYDLELELKSALGVDLRDPMHVVKGKIINTDKNVLEAVLERLNRYHDIVSPKQGQWMRNLPMDKKVNYLVSCLSGCIVDYIPSDIEVEYTDMVRKLDVEYPSTFDKLTYKDPDGNICETSEKIRIGSIYMMLLEKVGFDWSSVSVAKTQQNGIISYTASKDKHATPTKQQATRVLGESEIRVVASYAGGDFAIEMHDRSNNPQVRRHIVENILLHEKPTQIQTIVNRAGLPWGYSKPLQIVNHMMNCGGIALEYKPFDSSTQEKTEEDIFIHGHD